MILKTFNINAGDSGLTRPFQRASFRDEADPVVLVGYCNPIFVHATMSVVLMLSL